MSIRITFDIYVRLRYQLSGRELLSIQHLFHMTVYTDLKRSMKRCDVEKKGWHQMRKGFTEMETKNRTSLDKMIEMFNSTLSFILPSLENFPFKDFQSTRLSNQFLSPVSRLVDARSTLPKT